MNNGHRGDINPPSESPVSAALDLLVIFWLWLQGYREAVLVVRHHGGAIIIVPFHRKGQHMAAASVNVNVGHPVAIAIKYLDQNGNPMLTTPTPDSPPTWSQAPSASGIDSLSVASPGNLSASLATLEAGTDIITVNMQVGGVALSASLGVNISPAPQVLTSIELVPTVG